MIWAEQQVSVSVVVSVPKFGEVWLARCTQACTMIKSTYRTSDREGEVM